MGLNPQLVFFDVSRDNGMNVGHNPVQTVKPNQSKTYRWYAGAVSVVTQPDGTKKWVGSPVEFGATNLASADPVKHSNKGAIGARIIEPQTAGWIDSEWVPNPDATSARTQLKTRAQATITPYGGTGFREFVLLFQNDFNLFSGGLWGIFRVTQ